MTDRLSETTPSPRSRWWLGVSLVLVALQAVHSLCYPLAHDQAMACYIGQRLWEGRRLYADLLDTRPPALYWVYAVLVKIFGTTMWSVAFADIIWLLIISWLIFRFAERQLGIAAAVIGVMVHANWRVKLGYWCIAQPENFLTLLVLAAYFLSSRSARLSRAATSAVDASCPPTGARIAPLKGEPRGQRSAPLRWCLYDFLSGLLFGTAFWFKYNAVVFIPLLLVVPYLDFSPLDSGARLPRPKLSRGEWVQRLGMWAAGFGVAVVVVLGYFVWAGAWPAMKEMQFVVLPRFNSMVLHEVQSYRTHAFSSISLYLGWWSVLVGGLALPVAWGTRDLGRTLPVFLAAAMGALCIATQARLPDYAFETSYPFFAMLWGYMAVEVFQGFRCFSRWCRARGWRLAAVLVWMIPANVIYLPLPYEFVQLKLYVNDLQEWGHDRDTFYTNYPWARTASHYDGQMHVIDYLRHNSTSQDRVFIWGSEPLIYFLAQRNPPTRFVSNLLVVSRWTPPVWRQELIRSLEASPPQYIVVVRKDPAPLVTLTFLDSEAYLQRRFPALLEFLTGGYKKVDDYREFAIFRHG
jgi:hypothetical protein